MMKKLILLLIILLLTIQSSFATILNGDSTLLITSKELKEINIIFSEHKKLLTENELLNKQIEEYKSNNNNLVKIDSLKTLEIKSLNKEINKKNKTNFTWKICGISVSIGLFLLYLFK